MNTKFEKDGGTITIAGNNINAKNLAKELRYLQDVPEFYNYMTSYEYLKDRKSVV